jgi:CHAD domain-containing protein
LIITMMVKDSKEPTAGGVVQSSLIAALDRYMMYEQRALDGNTSDVHQARVATRRLRSDLKTFGILFNRVWVKHVREQLKVLGRILGDVRDGEVLLGNLRHAAERLSDRDSATPLLADLENQINVARKTLKSKINGTEHRVLIDELNALRTMPPFAPLASTPARTTLRPLLERCMKQLLKSRRKMGRAPSDADLHALRIDAKRLRYAAELAVPIWGEKAERLGAAVGKLQDVLGALHDALVAEAWLRRFDSNSDPRVVRTLSKSVVADAERSRRRWVDTWKAVKRKQLRPNHW